MKENNWNQGAFIFWTEGGKAVTPEEVQKVAQESSIDEAWVPPYAGDRMIVSRTMDRVHPGLYKEGYLLRPIKRTQEEVIYGIIAEENKGDHLEHTQEGTVSWTAEPDSSLIEGDHDIANRVRETYNMLRGKIFGGDWTDAIRKFTIAQHGISIRRGLFWVPTDGLESMRNFARFLDKIEIDLILNRVEPGPKTERVVKGAVTDSLAGKLQAFQDEVSKFDGRQNAKTYASRLELAAQLRSELEYWRKSLGVATSDLDELLTSLESRVKGMFDIRKSSTLKRKGKDQGELIAAPSPEAPSPEAPAPAPSPEPPAPSLPRLSFHGIEFEGELIDGIARYTSKAAQARSLLAAVPMKTVNLGTVKINFREDSIELDTKKDLKVIAPTLAGIGMSLS